jgi:hypothetical protein
MHPTTTITTTDCCTMSIPLLPPFCQTTNLPRTFRARTPIVWKTPTITTGGDQNDDSILQPSKNSNLVKVTATLTVPLERTLGRRSVSFATPLVAGIQDHIHRNDFTHEELRNTWLDRVEVEEIRHDAWNTVQWVLQRRKRLLLLLATTKSYGDQEKDDAPNGNIKDDSDDGDVDYDDDDDDDNTTTTTTTTDSSSSSLLVEEDEDSFFCERGLEVYFTPNWNKTRQRGLVVVMKAQEMARNRGQSPSSSMIAMVYHRATRESLQLAQAWAVHDSHEAALDIK